jgi:hypothetical protein
MRAIGDSEIQRVVRESRGEVNPLGQVSGIRFQGWSRYQAFSVKADTWHLIPDTSTDRSFRRPTCFFFLDRQPSSCRE